MATPARILLLFLAVLSVAHPAAADVLIPPGAVWKYLDDGSDQGTAWRETGFSDGSWDTGAAQLGYGDGDESTVVSYGPNPNAKFITTYFRRTFNVASASLYQSVDLRMVRDDGAVVYLNGVEILRSNIGGGTVTFTTPASSAIGGLDESAWNAAYFDPSPLLTGTNVLAVEIHQISGASSDISFDLELEAHATPTPIASAWSGAVTPTSVRVSAKSKLDGAVRLHVGTSPDLVGARISGPVQASAATNNRAVSIVMKGLDPGTPYHYALEVGGMIDSTKTGRFTTSVASPLTFSFAFASCAMTASSHPVFDTIRNLSPRFFFHMGDFHYENISVNDPVLFRRAYDTVLASPRQSELYRSVPINYMWDDHDYGPNNSDATSPSRTAARTTYQQYVPHYPLGAGSGDVPLYHAFSIGRVRFLVTDTRSERDPYTLPDSPVKTVLGAAQMVWFQQQLLEASGVYPVIVWVNTFPWIGAKGDDGWYSYTYERAVLADFIKNNGITGLYMISGDAHMLAIDDGSNSDYATGGGAPIPVMHAASLDQGGSVKGGPYSEGAFPGGGQFGLMTIEDDGISPICVHWSGRNTSNVEVVGWSRCDTAAPPADADADGVADVFDCAFADPATWARPGTVSGLTLDRSGASDVVFAFTSQDASAGPSTSYDIVDGSLSSLQAQGGFASASCHVSGLANTPYLDASGMPADGEGRYYLVRAANACGSGHYGSGVSTDPRFLLEGSAPCALP